tara:strand:+ start:598 stop:1644 length:1047 start_codon:yes stop_codon:yes gene_type:complete
MTNNSLSQQSNHKLHRRFIVGILNKFYKHASPKELPESINSIIILAQEKLGDAILLLPFINAFHKRFPDATIDLCCTSYNKKVFEGIPFIRNCISYRPFNFRFAKLIRSQQYQILYNPKSGPSSTFHHLTNVIHADVKVCLEDIYNNPIYNYHLPNKDDRHITEKYCELLFQYGLKTPVENWLPDYFYNFPSSISEKKYIAINISSGHQTRRLPFEKWKKIISYILDNDHEMHIALFASKKESSDAIKIKNLYKERVHFPLESPNLYYAAGIINNAQMLISIDTSLIHLAAALNKPIIGLYNNDKINYARYSPYNTISDSVISNSRFIRDIESESVIKSYNVLIKKEK